MLKHKPHFLSLTCFASAFLLLASCDNAPRNIPFPISDSGYAQPVTAPLQFSETKKLNWDTISIKGVKPVVKKFDIDAISSRPFDTAGFKPFIKPPQTTALNFARLPDTTFTLDALPSQSLKLKTSILPVPVITKTAAPVPKAGTDLSILEFGQLQGYRGKIITCFLKDRNGTIWIAGDVGLFSYDGEFLKNYLVGNPDDVILGMAEDDEGKIWIIQVSGLSVINLANGTISHSDELKAFSGNQISNITKLDKGFLCISGLRSGGIAVVGPVSFSFKHITRKNGLSSDKVFDATQDHDKNIWLSTTSGIDILTAAGNKLKHLTKENGLELNGFGPLTLDSKGHIWMASVGGAIDMADIQNGILQHYHKSTGRKDDFVIDLSADDNNNIWLYTNNSGIEIINPSQQKAKQITTKQGINSNFVIAGLHDKNKRAWIGTFTGINIIENGGEIIHPIAKKQVSASYQDSDGKLWLGGFGTGIEIVDRQKKQITILDKSHGISDDFIQAFYKIGNELWIASNGGLDIINFSNKNIRHIGQKEGLANNTVYAVHTNTQGDIWLAGPNGGIDFVNGQNTILKHAGIKEGLSDSSISDIKRDSSGLVWLATTNHGINIIDPVSQTIKYLENVPGLKGASNKVLLADEYNRMWIGTGNGLFIADMKAGTITTITTAQGLSDNEVTSLSKYKNSIIAGTANKVNIITPPEIIKDKAKWKIRLLKNSGRLVKETNSWATDLITREGEFVWCDNGVTIIKNIEEESDSTATYIAGISIMNRAGHFVNKYSPGEKDTLWSNDSFYIKGKIPPIESAALKQGLKWDSVNGAYNMPVNLRIPYNQNYFQFQYGQANLGRPDTTLYSYILEGIDNRWSAFTNKTVTENYLNLPPGNYTFKVSSKGLNGSWGKPAIFSFTITPPWYKTWWAYTFYALLAAGLLRAYIVYRSRRLQKENKLLEEKVALRTKQLQQSIEDLKATQAQLIQSEKMASLGELTAGIAHEIQNPLNFVNNFSEVNAELAAELKEELNKLEIPADQKNNLEEIADDIIQNQEKINFHGKRADGIVKGMLQHSRGNSGQKEPVDINALADEYLRLSYHGLRAKDKSFNATMKTEFDSNIPPVHIVRQDVGRVILNLFTNAFYSVTQKKNILQNGYEPVVSVYTKQLKNKVEIKVKDNGTGIPQKVLDKIFQPFFTTKPAGQGTGLGLSLSYDIITKMHGGEIKVETKEGEGAEFTILLPL